MGLIPKRVCDYPLLPFNLKKITLLSEDSFSVCNVKIANSTPNHGISRNSAFYNGFVRVDGF